MTHHLYTATKDGYLNNLIKIEDAFKHLKEIYTFEEGKFEDGKFEEDIEEDKFEELINSLKKKMG